MNLPHSTSQSHSHLPTSHEAGGLSNSFQNSHFHRLSFSDIIGTFSLKSPSRDSSPESDRQISFSRTSGSTSHQVSPVNLLQTLGAISHHKNGKNLIEDQWSESLSRLNFMQTKVLLGEVTEQLSDLTFEGSPRLEVYKEAYKLVQDRYKALEEQEDRDWMASLDSEEKKEMTRHLREIRKQKEAEESGYTWV